MRIVYLSVSLTTCCALAFALAASMAKLGGAPSAALPIAPHNGGDGGGSVRLPLLPLLCGYVMLGGSAVQPPLNAALADRTAAEDRGAVC